ncbi:MAG: hypothetical protein GY906_09930 [bacterium]|nr:hypothetical protein [bacterium]
MRRQANLAVVLAILTLIPAVDALAGFQASELIYIPVAARNAGLNGSQWMSDVTITNVDSEPVDVAIFHLPTGNISNLEYFQRQFALGGREDEEWGKVVEDLADIPPNGTITLENIMETHFFEVLNAEGLLGALVIFAYEAGTLDLDDGEGIIYRNVIAQGRNYTAATIYELDEDDQPVEVETSYGHTVPGVPWYDTADPGEHAHNGERQLSYLVLTGGVENDEYRYNVGMVNASDMLTRLILQVEARGPDGEFATNSDDEEAVALVNLEPMAHVQFDRIVKSLLGQGNMEDFAIWVRILQFPSAAEEPKPALTVYGTMVRESSNDAIFITPSYGESYPLDCVWGKPEIEPQGMCVSGSSVQPVSGPSAHLPFGVPGRR